MNRMIQHLQHKKQEAEGAIARYVDAIAKAVADAEQAKDDEAAARGFVAECDKLLALYAAPQPAGATISTMTVKVDSKDALDAVAALLEPGAVLMADKAVARLTSEFGVSRHALVACGGVLSTAKDEPEPANTPGPEYAEVQHVDDGAEVAPIRYVWLIAGDCTDEQRMWAVGVDDTRKVPRYAIPVDLLLPGQVDGRKVETL